MFKRKRRNHKRAQKRRDEQKRARQAYKKSRRLSQRWKRKIWKHCKPILEKGTYVVGLHFIKELVKKYLNFF